MLICIFIEVHYCTYSSLPRQKFKVNMHLTSESLIHLYSTVLVTWAGEVCGTAGRMETIVTTAEG